MNNERFSSFLFFKLDSARAGESCDCESQLIPRIRFCVSYNNVCHCEGNANKLCFPIIQSHTAPTDLQILIMAGLFFDAQDSSAT